VRPCAGKVKILLLSSGERYKPQLIHVNRSAMSRIAPFPGGSAPLDGLPELEPGWVWLAGAGPGDPGLVTLHTLNGLRQADVVVHDALVDARILAFARPGARLEFAGKRGGKPSMKQRDISARLIDLARAGRRVLRLKGGDPFLFGRGGEEALALVRAGVPFRVIPGVTAGIGGPACAGIPVTHRDINHAVTFVTGHAAGGAAPDDLDWEAIGRGSPVIVLYMAMKHLGLIAQRFIAAGRNGAEPVAVISKAATPDQRVLETTLARAAADAQAAGMEAPAIIVIGEVVRLRAGLDWQGALQGRTLDPDPLGQMIDVLTG
jgi:uroporphyrin-III C-methyltransferase